MDTPSQEIINAANTTIKVTDINGRIITIKKLSPFDKMQLASIVGAENAQNAVYLGYAILAYQVVEIDENLVPRPNSRASVEFLVKRLDEAGMNAIDKGVRNNKALFGLVDDENEQEHRDEVKNA